MVFFILILTVKFQILMLLIVFCLLAFSFDYHQLLYIAVEAFQFNIYNCLSDLTNNQSHVNLPLPFNLTHRNSYKSIFIYHVIRVF